MGLDSDPKINCMKFLLIFFNLAFWLGTMFASIIGGLLSNFYKWQYAYYILGAVGIFFSIVWCLLIANHFNPKTISHLNLMKTIPIPWKSILTSGSVCAICAGEIGNSWSFFLIHTHLSKYLENIEQVTIIENAFYSASPWFVLLIGIICVEPLCEQIIKNGKISKTNARRLYIFLGNVPSSICIILTSYIKNNREEWAIVLIHMAMFFKSCSFVGLKLNVLDHTQYYAIHCIGIYTIVSFAVAIIIPFIIGFVVSNVSGLALLYTGIWMNLELIQFSEECAISSRIATLLLISAGSLIIILGALGSCCTLKTNPSLYFWYKIILGLVVVLEIGIIVTIFQFKNCLANDHIPSAEDLPDGFVIDMETVDVPELNDIQTQYGCCGLIGYQDWTQADTDLPPPSCCKEVGCDTTDNSTIFTEGCYNKVHDEISSKVYYIGLLTGFLCFLPLAGMVISDYMSKAIKKPTDYNRI